MSGRQRSGRPVRSRRAWGWHPLTADWAKRVVDASPVRPGDLVLDLGAGNGALTAPLARLGAEVLAVELHAGRAARLVERFGGRVRVLPVDLRELRWPRRPFRVVASPPYQLSSELVRGLLGTDRLLSADLVLQRATVRRLAEAGVRARHVRRYRLSEGDRLPRSAFRPPPQVDSSVLRIRRR